MEAITGLIEGLVMNFFFGEEILGLLDKYLIYQSDLNKVLIVLGAGFLSLIGVLSIIKAILKMTKGALKLVLLLALAYYLVVVVMGIDVLGLIFN
ncbi:hypothetical protein RJG79_00115 [Mycoplasmatota bacterium WC44]